MAKWLCAVGVFLLGVLLLIVSPFLAYLWARLLWWTVGESAEWADVQYAAITVSAVIVWLVVLAAGLCVMRASIEIPDAR